MIIDFHQAQLQKFMALAMKIEAEPELYLQFESVADFYKADWLQAFPSGTEYFASGLDDGAEEFYALICYGEMQLRISCVQEQFSAKLCCKH